MKHISGRDIFNKKPVGYWHSRWQKANKRAKKWRVSRNYWIEGYGFMRDQMFYYWEDFKDADLKQKQAWMAFYIATILYIVGIIILI